MAYIDKGLLLKDIGESVVFTVRNAETSPELRGARKIIDRIENAPTADVVEVVRCKDCYKTIGQSLTEEKLCCVHEITVPDNYYCASGERKEQGENRDVT